MNEACRLNPEVLSSMPDGELTTGLTAIPSHLFSAAFQRAEALAGTT